VPTRWRSWVQAVNLHSEQSETVKLIIVAKFPCEAAVSVHESQSAFSNPKVPFNCPYRKQFRLVSEEYKTFRISGISSAGIYGHNENAS
jgi:hypothetical protein